MPNLLSYDTLKWGNFFEACWSKTTSLKKMLAEHSKKKSRVCKKREIADSTCGAWECTNEAGDPNDKRDLTGFMEESFFPLIWRRKVGSFPLGKNCTLTMSHVWSGRCWVLAARWAFSFILLWEKIIQLYEQAELLVWPFEKKCIYFMSKKICPVQKIFLK